MTLLQVIQAIERVAAKQPSVNTIVRENVFLLNENPAARYGVFSWSQNQHGESISTDYRSYRFTFFYVDRLTESKDNAVECQSVGIETLGNIIRELGEVLPVSDWAVDVFRDRFADECAGAYCSVTLQALRGSACWEDFPEFYEGDFNNDFNDDFLRWKAKEVAIIK